MHTAGVDPGKGSDNMTVFLPNNVETGTTNKPLTLFREPRRKGLKHDGTSATKKQRKPRRKR